MAINTCEVGHPALLGALRAAWVMLVTAGMALFAAGSVVYYDSILTSTRFLPYAPLLAQRGLSMAFLAGWLVGFDLVTALVCLAVALLIFWRRSHDLSAYIISLTIFFVGVGFSYALAQLDPLLGAVVITIGFYFFILPLNLFPHGRHLPRWTRAVSALTIPYFLLTLPLQVAALDVRSGATVPPTYGAAVLGMAAILALGLIGQVVRYRRYSTPVQRQQTKFVVYGLALGLGLDGLMWLTTALPEAAHPLFAPDRSVYTDFSLSMMLLAKVLDTLASLCVPFGFGFAILRARLWDIDVVINRSLVYGGTTALLAVLLVLAALGLNRLFGNTQPAVAMLSGVLLALALFNPSRRAVQRFIDRRIYGFRFDLDQLQHAQRGLPLPQRGAFSGQRLGAYHLLEVIGSGGMAEVYRAEANGQAYAVKVLPYADDVSPELRERFIHEAALSHRLDHPNVAKVHAYGEGAACFYIVMELLSGVTLQRYLKQTGPMPLEAALPIVQRLASALDYIHAQGLVHRDLKPSNVMVNPQASWLVKLMDFGIAKSVAATSITNTGTVGTINYMAPEQIREAQTIDHRADLYALAVLTFELLTGKRPFVGSPTYVMFAHLHQPPPPLRQVLPSASANVEQALLRGMAKDPDERFSSAEAFVRALMSC